MLESDDSDRAFYNDTHYIDEEVDNPTVFTRIYNWWEGF
tara:strand:- start:155 stop:271 length:117 start_codon:yes stop_codon:yes gene_type:complete